MCRTSMTGCVLLICCTTILGCGRTEDPPFPPVEVAKQPSLAEAIVGKWVPEDPKNDRKITFWSSGEFEMHRGVEPGGKGIWKINETVLRLEFEPSNPKDPEVDGVAWSSEEVEIVIDNKRLTVRVPSSSVRHTYTRLGDAPEQKPKLVAPPVLSAPTFSASSEKLRQTVLVPALDTPLSGGKSAVWCATLPLAWQRMEKEVVKEEVVKAPLVLTGAEQLSRSLSQSPSPGLRPEHYYAAAGFLKDGIMDQIRRDLPRRFPRAPLPDARNLSEHGAVAYGYLEVSLKYLFAYKDSELLFRGSDGTKTRVKAFGIREVDRGKGQVRLQVRVLFHDKGEFAVDLNEMSKPYQLIVARVERKPSLRDAVQDTGETHCRRSFDEEP